MIRILYKQLTCAVCTRSMVQETHGRWRKKPTPACGVGSNCNSCNTYILSRFHFFLSPSPPLSRFLSPSHSLTYTHTHTHTHTHDTRGAAWVQVLCKEGGMPLIMCVKKNGASCLFIAAQNGHAAVVEVRAGGGRLREKEGRVSAATVHGTWCRDCRQHTAPLVITLQHTAAHCCSVRSS